jgi:hypothetical protein
MQRQTLGRRRVADGTLAQGGADAVLESGGAGPGALRRDDVQPEIMCRLDGREVTEKRVRARFTKRLHRRLTGRADSEAAPTIGAACCSMSDPG